jgi:hypothetical protein
MSALLVRGPLRTSPSMLLDGAEPDSVTVDSSDLPLAYAYADWTPAPQLETEELGHFDAGTQTWVSAPGTITAGHWTYSYNKKKKLVVDDACA